MTSTEWEPDKSSPEQAGRTNFAIIPNAIFLDPNMSGNAVKIYCILARHINQTTDTAWPSIRKIGEYAGIKHLPTVRKYLAELHSACWIEWRQRTNGAGKQTSNLYRLFDSPEKHPNYGEHWVANATSQGVANATSQGVANATSQGVANATPIKKELNKIELNKTEPPIPPTGGQTGPGGYVHIEGQTDVLEILEDAPKPPPAKRATQNDHDLVLFDQFWQAFPRRTNKAGARTAFVKALKKASFETIMAGAAAYANDPNRVPQYTKHPSTWLNNECWDDDPLPNRHTGNGPSTMERMQNTMVIGQQLQDQLNGNAAPVPPIEGQPRRQHTLGFNSGYLHAGDVAAPQNATQARAIEQQLGQLGKMD